MAPPPKMSSSGFACTCGWAAGTGAGGPPPNTSFRSMIPYDGYPWVAAGVDETPPSMSSRSIIAGVAAAV